LVGGDSDSSALTQESGDETVPPTPRESVLTGTDAGTDQGEDEDVEMAEQNAGMPLLGLCTLVQWLIRP
jgi:MRG-binding protein